MIFNKLEQYFNRLIVKDQGLSLSSRLRIIVLGASLAGLVLFTIIMTVHEYNIKKQTLLKEIQVLTQIVAARSSAATVFSDSKAANSNLASLLLKKDIDFACIHSITKLLAFKKSSKLSNIHESECQPQSTLAPYYFTKDYVFVHESIVINNHHVGWVTVRANLSFIESEIKKYLVFLTCLILLVLLFCYLISNTFVEGAVKPIKDLKKVTEMIGEKKDYSIRASFTRLDETGVLVKSFNNMLEVIEQKDRLKSLFFSNMNHEIRAPLNGLMGILQLLQKSHLDDQQKHYVQIALGSGKYMLSLINDILDFSKLDEQQFSVEKLNCQIATVLFECLNPMAIKAEEKLIDFEFYMGKSVPMTIQTDPTRLKQVVTNLVNNAIKFCNIGGVEVKLTLEEGWLQISISDTGIGIPSDRLEAIFSPYVQANVDTARHFGGTGLGLSISKKIVALLGGELKVESVEGVGSNFYFAIPVAMDGGQQLSSFIETLPQKVNLSSAVFHLISPSDRSLEFIHDLFKYAHSEPVLKINYSHVTGPEVVPAIVLPSTQEQAQDLLKSIDYGAHPRGLVFGALREETYFYDLCKNISNKWRYISIPVDPSQFYQSILEIFSDEYSSEQIKSSLENNSAYSHMVALVAEDDITNQMVIAKILEKYQVRTEVVSNGLECIKRLQSGNFYDVIFMDCEMPVMDGFAASELIRDLKLVNRQGRAIPIVALTGRTQEQDMKKCYVSGMDFHLTKPIDFDAIKSVLGQVSV